MKLSHKIIGAISLLLLVGLSTLIFSLNNSQKHSLKNLAEHSNSSISELLAVQLAPAIRFKQTAAITGFFTKIAANENSSLTSAIVLDTDGEVISAFDSERFEPVEMSEILDLHNDRANTEVGTTAQSTSDHQFFAVPILTGNQDKPLGTLAIAWNKNSVNQSVMQAYQTGFALTGIILVAMIAVVTWLMRGLVIKPLDEVIENMTMLANGKDTVEIPFLSRRDEIGKVASALEVFRQNIAEKKEFQKRAEEQRVQAEIDRRQAISGVAESLENSVGNSIEAVTIISEKLTSTAQSMALTISGTKSEAENASADAEHVTSNATTVADATAELTATIREIGQQVAYSNDVSKKAVEEAEEASTIMKNMMDKAGKVASVIDLINDIAEQTNLLALNATIEAARAGENGRGFAVVASEVKGLATQTANATKEISDHINEMHSSTLNSTKAIESINSTISEIEKISSGIAAAVEQQDNATVNITENVQKAANGTKSVSRNIDTVSKATREASESTELVLMTATELSSQADQLKLQIDGFLRDIRAA